MNSKVKQIIKEEIELFLENFEFNDSKKLKKYIPTDSMKKQASLALSVVEKNNLTKDGGNEGSGIKKAKSIASGEEITHGMLKRMKAFFDNNQGFYDADRSSGKNINNSGIIQSWNLWGGDPGRTFVNQNIDFLKDSNLKRKKLRRDINVGTGSGKATRLIDTTYHRKK